MHRKRHDWLFKRSKNYGWTPKILWRSVLELGLLASQRNRRRLDWELPAALSSSLLYLDQLHEIAAVLFRHLPSQILRLLDLGNQQLKGPAHVLVIACAGLSPPALEFL